MNTHIRNEITKEFDRIHDLACDLFPAYRNAMKPSLSFFTKGRSAGVANYSNWNVAINEYVGSQNLTMIFNTISHELAHIVAMFVYRERGHGANWKRVHRALGGNGERCYNADESGVKVMQKRRTNWYKYRCPISGIESWVGAKFHAGLGNGKYTGLTNTSHGISIKRDHYTGVSELRG